MNALIAVTFCGTFAHTFQKATFTLSMTSVSSSTNLWEARTGNNTKLGNFQDVNANLTRCRSYYTRRKFRPIYAKVMNSYVNTHRKPSTFQRTAGANSMSLVTGLLPFTSEMALFSFPFNELLIWAVLTKRQQMALLMWTHGEEALAKSLVACKLYKAMAHEAADDDLDTEIYDELRNYAKEFESKGLRLLDFCYRQDGEKTQKLLTCELTSWSNQSCLSLAVAANHRAILAHPSSQIILADLWMGALRTRKNTNLNVSFKLKSILPSRSKSLLANI